MNPFAAHAANMKAYEQACAEPVNGVDGNYILFGGAKYTAIVGQFIVQQVLAPDGSGFTPMLLGEVIVQKDIVPGIVFHAGQKITSVAVGGESHDCQVRAVHGTFTEWRLQLWDANEGA